MFSLVLSTGGYPTDRLDCLLVQFESCNGTPGLCYTSISEEENGLHVMYRQCPWSGAQTRHGCTICFFFMNNISACSSLK